MGATAVVILTIVLTMMLIRTLGQAAAGLVGARDVVLLLLYLALGQLPLILSLSLFVATIATFTRMYRDSEMSVWLASGVGLRRFLRPVLRAALPALLVLAAAVLVARPWSQERVAELKDLHARRSDLSKVAPGEFQASKDGRRVFYIDRRDNDEVVGTHVFILASRTGQEAVTTAERGEVVLDHDRRMLALTEGQRTTVDTRSGERSQARFESAIALVSDDPIPMNMPLAPRELSTWNLLWNPAAAHRAELTWRIGMVVSAVNLLLLAIGLARGGPRQSTNWNLIVGLLTFVVYTNLMNLLQSQVAVGRAPPWIALVALHGFVAACAATMFWWRQRGGVVFRIVPWSRRR